MHAAAPVRSSPLCYPPAPGDLMSQNGPRVAVIRGVRTPFAKSGTSYARLTALDLGKMAVTELVERTGVNPSEIQEVVFGNVIQEVVFGNVIPSVKAPNIARE